MPWPKGKPRPLHLRRLHSDMMSHDRNPNWAGGRYVRHDGYVVLKLHPGHPHICMTSSGRRVLEHRLIMAEHLDRDLRPGEVVHHVDGDPSNNDISNLQVFESNEAHAAHHMKERERSSDGRIL